MKQSNYTVQILEPTNGWLTQSQEIEIQNRVFSKKVFLAVNDSIDNWTEITEEEYAAYQVELEEYNKSLEENKEITYDEASELLANKEG